MKLDKIQSTVRPLLVLWALLPSESFGWGERGHDLITRVAVRMLIHDKDQHPTFVAPWADKEHMLAHLSNAPDFHWRSEKNVGKEVTKLNSPTHFVDIEYIAPGAKFDDFPRRVQEAEKRMTELCKTPPKDYVCPVKGDEKPRHWHSGSAPWRIVQLTDLMGEAFRKAKQAETKKDDKAKESAINEALLFGGLLSHFVGDLGNPHHTSRDYDGWEINQGGVHSYFETAVVNAFDFSLDQDLLDYALQKRPANRLFEHVAQKERPQPNALDLSIALSLDSFQRLATVSDLDRKHALEKDSSEKGGLRIKAKRKAAADVKDYFRPLIIERLATAADTLSRLWKSAWIKGGKPDLSKFHSYEYPLAPDFVAPDYTR